MSQLYNTCVFLLFLQLLVGCSGSDSHSHGPTQQEIEAFSGEYPIEVLCTTGQVAEMVRRIGGEHLVVTACSVAA